MWEGMKIAPPRGSEDKDVKGPRQKGSVGPAWLSPGSKRLLFCELSVDYILTSCFIGWTFFFFDLLQSFITSDMHVSRFAAGLLLFFTGTCCKYNKVVQVVESDLWVDQKKSPRFHVLLMLFFFNIKLYSVVNLILNCFVTLKRIFNIS